MCVAWSLFLFELFNYTANKQVFVLPGKNSVKKGYNKAVKKGLTNIHLLEGTHIVTTFKDEDGDDMPGVLFEVPMTVSGDGLDGDGREKTRVKGNGFLIKGTNDQHCTFLDMLIMRTEYSGVKSLGMSFDCRRVRFFKCGTYGVCAKNTKGRLTNCTVTGSRRCGIFSDEGGTIEIEGEESRMPGHNNSARDTSDSDNYGLYAKYSSSIIHLLSPLTKEDVSKNNNDKRWYDGEGGENYGGDGTIETVNSF